MNGPEVVAAPEQGDRRTGAARQVSRFPTTACIIRGREIRDFETFTSVATE
jgi:hypothetical protein